MIDQYIYKDVWQKNDAKAERDSIAAWNAASDKLGILSQEDRAKLLCVAAYDGERLCATLTVQVRYMPLVRENMAFIQIFVAPEYRQKGVVIPLSVASYVIMCRYALENPAQRIGGMAGRVTTRGTLDKPFGGALFMLAGYTERNEPIMIRWFDHFKIDEDAARARDPRKMQQQAN